MSLYTETLLLDPVNSVLLFFQSQNGMNELKLVSIFQYSFTLQNAAVKQGYLRISFQPPSVYNCPYFVP